MKEEEAYLAISKRYIDSCQRHVDGGINIQEVLGFKTYHAFESIASAYNSHYGHQIPNPHPKKLNLFVRVSSHDRSVNGRAIATLAMVLSSMRNRYLYPEKVGTNYKSPQDQISMTDAKDLIRRVKGIIRQVDRQM